jgi:uridine kinase
MNEEFARILHAHAARYPLMEPQDFGKLAHQNACGPAHLIADEAAAKAALVQEWRQTPAPGTREPEAIGNGLFRFPLTEGNFDEEAAVLLARLFSETAREYATGDASRLVDNLTALEALQMPSMDAWLRRYRQQNCPAVHHSAAYQQAYQPHYRLLSARYACYFPLLCKLEKLMHQNRPVIVAIDGRCGSGKTELARLIGELYPCNICHMDDFYLPIRHRAENWEQLPGGNMDFARLNREILQPLSRGESVRYAPYNCRTGELEAATGLSPCSLTVLEGSYSLHPAVDAVFAERIFLTCSTARQETRLRSREGAYFEGFARHWIPMEERYYQKYAVQQSAREIDTTRYF